MPRAPAISLGAGSATFTTPVRRIPAAVACTWAARFQHPATSAHILPVPAVIPRSVIGSVIWAAATEPVTAIAAVHRPRTIPGVLPAAAHPVAACIVPRGAAVPAIAAVVPSTVSSPAIAWPPTVTVTAITSRAAGWGRAAAGIPAAAVLPGTVGAVAPPWAPGIVILPSDRPVAAAVIPAPPVALVTSVAPGIGGDGWRRRQRQLVPAVPAPLRVPMAQLVPVVPAATLQATRPVPPSAPLLAIICSGPVAGRGLQSIPLAAVAR